MPVPEPPEEAPSKEVLEPKGRTEKPPAPPPPLARQVVAPEGLPSHEQVAKWVAYERESKRERKKARWEAGTRKPCGRELKNACEYYDLSIVVLQI